jgi:hypothetical protein
MIAATAVFTISATRVNNSYRSVTGLKAAHFRAYFNYFSAKLVAEYGWHWDAKRSCDEFVQVAAANATYLYSKPQIGRLEKRIRVGAIDIDSTASFQNRCAHRRNSGTWSSCDRS